MHPRNAALIAFCDAEGGAGRSRRIARHLAKCAKCRGRLGRIERERDELSARAAEPASDVRPSLAPVLSAIAAWQEGRNGAAASELRARLRWQIEAYFGSRAGSAVEGPGMAAEEMLGKASEMLEVFLGPEAAEAVRDEVFRGLDWAEPAEEICR
jgi:anti-sigma factor RsiW